MIVLQGVNRDRFEKLALGLCLPQALLVWEYSDFFSQEFCCGVGSSALPTCTWAGSQYKSLECLVQSLEWAVKQAGE